jgi:precorrin-6B methylase 1
MVHGGLAPRPAQVVVLRSGDPMFFICEMIHIFL